jgi:polysaccharide export outer membrane protein
MKLLVIVAAVLSTCIHSCSSPKELRYLQGSLDSAQFKTVNIPEPLIQKGDVLSIVVFSDNPAASAGFNIPMNAAGQVSIAETATPSLGSGGSSSNPSVGYLVDKDGNIQFPRLGNLQVEGLSKAQLTDLLDSKLKDKFLTNPYYSIRTLNLKISIIGEVKNPGVYSMSAEKMNILEAISIAGDLTYFGMRENILVIRERNGIREFGRLNLTQPEIFTSPFFQLQQNDIVMVDMRKQKIAANDQVLIRNITLLLSIVTSIAVIYNIFR